MSHRRVGPLALVALALVVAAAAGFWGVRQLGRGAGPDPAETAPAGRWHRVGRPSPDEEAARVLSLPYSAGGARATGRSGVTFHDRERAFPGTNLYVSGHGPEVILMDMEGAPLHRWRCPFERAFPGRRPDPGTAYFRRAHPLPDGGLLAIYQGGGMVRLDRGSNLLWAADVPFYNDFFVHPDGRIVALTKAARRRPEIRPEAPVLEDSLVELGPDGRVKRKVSLLDTFQRSRFAGLLEPLGGGSDIFHSNTVEVLDGRFAHRSEVFRAGNVLVSLRELDVVAIVDPDRPDVVWARRGDWDGQHQPTMVEPGHVMLFDNRGWRGHSRVLEFDPLDGAVAWEHKADPPALFSSPEAGSCQRLGNGNTLITESERGRAFEVTRAGEIVWEFVSPHRAGRQDELVATLFEVIRLGAGNDRASP